MGIKLRAIHTGVFSEELVFLMDGDHAGTAHSGGIDHHRVETGNRFHSIRPSQFTDRASLFKSNFLIAQGNALINRFYNEKQVSFVYSLAVLGNHPGDPVMLILRVKQLTVVTLEMGKIDFRKDFH